MKALLMHPDQDVDLQRELPPHQAALIQDLELSTLFDAMAGGDQFLYEVAERAVLSSLQDPEAICYRQQVLGDCLQQPAIVRELYGIAVEAIQRERKIWGVFMNSPDMILHHSLQVLELFVGILKRLRAIADSQAGRFRSEGFRRFFAMLATELDDEYFLTVEAHLQELRFRRGVLLSAELGKGNKGIRYVLRRAPELSWRERLGLGTGSGYGFTIPDRDENGFKALEELRARGINQVANALAQSTDHILSFFACCGPSSASTSRASTCMSGWQTRASQPASPSPSRQTYARWPPKGSTTSVWRCTSEQASWATMWTPMTDRWS
jgi:hypothetical protein